MFLQWLLAVAASNPDVYYKNTSAIYLMADVFVF